jgi:hypothetical protein
MEKGRGTTLSILKFEISINVVRLLVPDHAVVQEVVEVSLNGYLQLSPDLSGLDIHLCNVAVGAAR